MTVDTRRGGSLPRAYAWLVSHSLVGFEAKSQLEPWYFLRADEWFDVRSRWPSRGEELLVFARRQDDDILACFEMRSNEVAGVVVINGWTERGYDVLGRYPNLWEWLKSIIDDIAEVAEPLDAGS